MLLVVDADDSYQSDHLIIQKLSSLDCPVFVIINKIDLLKDSQQEDHLLAAYSKLIPQAKFFLISALQKKNIQILFDQLMQNLPEGPVYYPQDQLSDRSERFFVSEIIRENIFLLYQEEIPYSCEVVIDSFKDEPTIVRIEALIFVSRKTQQAILIGKGGRAIKQLGIDSRLKIEAFLEKKVFLQLRVKVREDWRNNDLLLQRLGYNQ
jgi:GTP-binding protein Era